MFGYIKPHPPELKVKEYEFYKSIYCGLCKCMGNKTTCFSRLTLSYDIVFLVLIRSALLNENFKLENKRCFVHPLRKRPMSESNPTLEYCVSVSGLLNYHKIRDDLRDNRGIRRIAVTALLPPASVIRKKVIRDVGDVKENKNNLAELDKIIQDHLTELSGLERERAESVDAPAEVFGRLLAAVMEFALEDEYSRRIAHEIGLHIGRWIYITDAADDYHDDMKTGSYNPIISMNADESDLDEMIRTSLLMELTQVEKALNLIEFKDSSIENIIKNIIYLGMVQCAEKILTENKKEQKL